MNYDLFTTLFIIAELKAKNNQRIEAKSKSETFTGVLSVRCFEYLARPLKLHLAGVRNAWSQSGALTIP